MPPLPVDAALAAVLERARPLEPEAVPLAQALGRTLAEDVVAREDVPLTDNAAMDGFAVRSADIAGATAEAPVALRIVTEIVAGRVFEGEIHAGECARIMTGAAVPRGADEVIEVEKTEPGAGDDAVLVKLARGPGKQVRRAGEDLARGAAALAKGTLLGPAEVGLLASLGAIEPLCGRRPRAAILSTGDEVISPEVHPAEGQVRDANGAALAAAVAAAGGEAIPLGIAPDDPRALADHLRSPAADEADIVIVTAGISKSGARDYTADVLAKLGWREVFREVAMKPGRPSALFEREGRLLFALAGNPVAAIVTFLLLVRPALLQMQGRRKLALPEARVAAQRDKEERPGRVNFVRVRLLRSLEGPYRVAQTLPEGSGLLHTMHVANALLRCEGAVRAGDPLRALVFGEVEVDGG
jgi:molybdopterin molybdotransferase